MLIKEGAIIKIIDNNQVVIEKIVVQEDMNIESDEYTFLLRHRDCSDNVIFESEKIYKKGNEYIAEGYFKDAILVISDRYGNEMYKSYTEHDC